MRSVDTAIQNELESQELTPFYLLTIEIGSNTYRYTDADVPIPYDIYGDTSGFDFVDGDMAFVDGDMAFIGSSGTSESGLWEPRGFKFDPISYSMDTIVDQARITLDNRDDVLTVNFVGGTPQGSTVYLRKCVLDANDAVLGAVIMFQGDIDAWNLDQSQIAITVTSIANRWNQRTLNLYSPSCRWKEFGGPECQYDGTSWCDRTYSRCCSLGNSDNFGGFRWLPSIIDKEIWWGSVRDP